MIQTDGERVVLRTPGFSRLGGACCFVAAVPFLVALVPIAAAAPVVGVVYGVLPVGLVVMGVRSLRARIELEPPRARFYGVFTTRTFELGDVAGIETTASSNGLWDVVRVTTASGRTWRYNGLASRRLRDAGAGGNGSEIEEIVGYLRSQLHAGT